MSFSSCPRMWQCHTYSAPKLYMVLTVGVVVMGCPVVGLMLVKPVVSPSGFEGLRGRMLSGTAKGVGRQIGLLGDKDDFQRVHPDGFLPAPLVGLGGFDRPVPADPVDNLRIVQVDVDRMGVHAIMGDLPKLDLASGGRSLRADRCKRNQPRSMWPDWRSDRRFHTPVWQLSRPYGSKTSVMAFCSNCSVFCGPPPTGV